LAKRYEPTQAEKIKAALLADRDKMRQARYKREFATVYNGGICPVCKDLAWDGAVCRKHRGVVCSKHCLTCDFFERHFWHCMYRETEPLDMRKIMPIHGSTDKESLWRGIYMWEHGISSPLPEDLEPTYFVADKPDENGDYAIINERGEVTRYVAKYLASVPIWEVIMYLPPGQ